MLKFWLAVFMLVASQYLSSSMQSIKPSQLLQDASGKKGKKSNTNKRKKKPCADLQLLDRCKAKTGKASGNHKRGNQYTKKDDAEVTPQVLRKRMCMKFNHAIKKAPVGVQQKWDEICNLKGQRGMGIFQRKREFMIKWAEDKTWQSSYFTQSLNLSVSSTHKLRGVWIPMGRLEKILGPKEAQKALEEGWYDTKPGVGSQVLVFYTEESRTAVKEKKVSKEVKGGEQLTVAEGKNVS